jgi:para-aminobenzoate synthetase/4-amino-4-deoxychorismate lyase
MLVVDGRPVELDAHLARLESSLEDLFPDREAPELSEAIDARARDIEIGAIRATVAPAGMAELEGKVESRRLPGSFMSLSGKKEPGARVAVHSFTVEGGLGCHKWVDRRPLDRAQSILPEDALPMVVDEGDTILEAARANVFAVRDDTLFTPPTDGRILPGITRMRTLEIAASKGVGVCEAELRRDDLLAADEVFLTGSVRGVERVRSIDGIGLRGDGSVASDLGVELRRTWLAAKVG